MNEQPSYLCCCEYIDLNNETNHILACCCNCTDLDESFDSLITGKSVTERNKSGLLATMQDRLRIPWYGGAKQVAFDAVLPIIMLPIILLLATISLVWTVFAFSTALFFLIYIFNFFIKLLPKTKFFVSWVFTSIVILYVVFEFIVIPFLEILLEENIALSILIGAFLLCFYLLKLRTSQLNSKFVETDFETGNIGRPNKVYNCSICQTYVPERDHHCVWYDCCIGKHNQCLFILSLIFALAALLYSSNLTLTSVCHPFIFYKTILLPDDCSDVYQQFEYSLAFVTAIYSLGLAVLVFTVLILQILLVSLGLTNKEWSNLSLVSKCCLGLTSNRPHNRGFVRNWIRIICWTRNYYSALNQTIH